MSVPKGVHAKQHSGWMVVGVALLIVGVGVGILVSRRQRGAKAIQQQRTKPVAS